jgi:hypothetical protein
MPISSRLPFIVGKGASQAAHPSQPVIYTLTDALSADRTAGYSPPRNVSSPALGIASSPSVVVFAPRPLSHEFMAARRAHPEAVVQATPMGRLLADRPPEPPQGVPQSWARKVRLKAHISSTGRYVSLRRGQFGSVRGL